MSEPVGEMAKVGRPFGGLATKQLEQDTSWKSIAIALVYAVLDLSDGVRGARWENVRIESVPGDETQ